MQVFELLLGHILLASGSPHCKGHKSKPVKSRTRSISSASGSSTCFSIVRRNGRAPYSGGKRYRGVDRCDVLLTLGTPHYSLEAYPFGRIEERRAGDGLDEDLAVLGVDYVDMLMLRESPDCAVMQAMWSEMEKAKAEGRVRSLGVVTARWVTPGQPH